MASKRQAGGYEFHFNLSMRKDEMAFTELIYVSTAVDQRPQGVKAILESAVRHNQLNGITGMLLYYRGGFLQVLEGGEAQVLETYARICADQRHHSITRLSVSLVPQRRFDKWSMGFKHVTDGEIAAFSQLEPIFKYQTQPDALKVKSGLALEMLTLFSTGPVWRASAAERSP